MTDATETSKKKNTIHEKKTEKKTSAQKMSSSDKQEKDSATVEEKKEPYSNLTTGCGETSKSMEASAIPEKAPGTNELSSSGSGVAVDKADLSNINVLSGVPVNLTLSVGDKKMMIADVLKLKAGSIIQLDRREYEPLDISLNGTLFAKGEVVLLGEHYGLRILEIL